MSYARGLVPPTVPAAEQLAEGTEPVAVWEDERVIFRFPLAALHCRRLILEERRYVQGMLQLISSLLARFSREDEEGQTLVEYGLLLALIAIIVIVALLFLGPIVSQIFSNVAENLNN